MPQKIYIALWEDRHADATVHPFELFDDAERWARKELGDLDKEYGVGPIEEEALSADMIRDGWRLRLKYGESNSLTIFESDLAPASVVPSELFDVLPEAAP